MFPKKTGNFVYMSSRQKHSPIFHKLPKIHVLYLGILFFFKILFIYL